MQSFLNPLGSEPRVRWTPAARFKNASRNSDRSDSARGERICERSNLSTERVKNFVCRALNAEGNEVKRM